LDIVVATSNRGKLREISDILSDFSIKAYSELIEPFEIVEDGNDFKENALIKARAVFDSLGRDDLLVLADDSGISVPLLGGEPGLYSARYAGSGASDKENLELLIKNIKSRDVQRTEAFYSCAIALVSKNMEYVTHGFMYGSVIVSPRGDNGFGYDPVFIPKGFEKTLGEIDSEVKKSFSHRGKALSRMKIILKNYLSDRVE